MRTAMQIWIENNYLKVPKFVIERAVKSLDELEALALIRGSFISENNSWTSLKEAQEIYRAIKTH